MPPGPHYVLAAREVLFEVGARPGDQVLIRPGQEDQVVLIRRLAGADYAALAASVQAGRAEVIAGIEQEDAIAHLVLCAAGAPRAPRGRGGARVFSIQRAVK